MFCGDVAGFVPQPWLPALSPSELCSTGNAGSDTHPEPPAARFHVLENKNRILIFRLFSRFGTERLRQTDRRTDRQHGWVESSVGGCWVSWSGGEGLLASLFSPWQLLSMATTESRATQADLLTSSEEEEEEDEEGDEERLCGAPWKIIHVFIRGPEPGDRGR